MRLRPSHHSLRGFVQPLPQPRHVPRRRRRHHPNHSPQHLCISAAAAFPCSRASVRSRRSKRPSAGAVAAAAEALQQRCAQRREALVQYELRPRVPQLCIQARRNIHRLPPRSRSGAGAAAAAAGRSWQERPNLLLQAQALCDVRHREPHQRLQAPRRAAACDAG